MGNFFSQNTTACCVGCHSPNVHQGSDKCDNCLIRQKEMQYAKKIKEMQKEMQKEKLERDQDIL